MTLRAEKTLVALVLAALLVLDGRSRRPGSVFCSFLLAYGILRLAMTPVRMEILRSATMLSVAFVLAGLTGLLVLRSGEAVGRRARRTGRRP